MAHYFDLDPSLASKERPIEFMIDGRIITLISDNGVFSKNKIDEEHKYTESQIHRKGK